jgi:multicomponent Na+:H+ antiporter subunit A
MLLALLGLHGALAIVAPIVAPRVARRVFLLCGLAPAATTLWAAWNASAVIDGAVITETLRWVPSMGVEAAFVLDAFSLLMVGLVSGIGTLIFVYAYGYFSKPVEGLGRFTGALTGFAGSMLGLVLADNLLVVFVFWELTSVTSYLLIGFENHKKPARDAALQALLTTGGGGLAMLAGFVIVGELGSYSIRELATTDFETGGLLGAGLVLVLVGAFTKSAQVPFHTWLPGAMAAPTPVSAYLHSATMVKAGVYLVARLAPIFAAVGPWRPLVVAFGLATMVVGGYRALRQHDLKLLLAFGTVSQLGFMMVLFGLGTAETTFAATAMILAHGLFKAALFMVVGVIDKKAGTRDVRELGGLGRAMPLTVAAGTIAAISMAGLPPLFGFIAKEAAYETLLGSQAALGGLGLVAIAGVVAGSVLTFAYTARLVAAIWGCGDGAAGVTAVPASVADPAPAFGGPAVVLAVLSIGLGLVPLLVDTLVNAAAAALDPAWEGAHLALWHGLNLPLALSGLTIAAGGGLYLLRTPVARLQDAAPAFPSATGGYEAAVAATLAGAKRLTGVVQNGSLPVYLGVILLTLLALPGSALVRTAGPQRWPELSPDPVYLVVAATVIVAAVATTVAGRRFVAVLMLGAVGFGVGMLFVLQGAPDLALTQFLVETLALVVFVLVLRHLPDRFRPQPFRLDRVARVAIAGAVGVFVFAFALVAGGSRVAPPISGEFLARAVPEAEGRNVVNVILVDFRALDTLGEITVLAIAAMGVASLVMASRLERSEVRYTEPKELEAGRGRAR